MGSPRQREHRRPDPAPDDLLRQHEDWVVRVVAGICASFSLIKKQWGRLHARYTDGG